MKKNDSAIIHMFTDMKWSVSLHRYQFMSLLLCLKQINYFMTI